MFKKTAEFYDALYSWKDYATEAQKVHAFIQQHKQSPGTTLLDVACGTGAHITHLREHYTIEGLDLDEGMLAVARQRHPDIKFHHGNMTDFELGRKFDVITCFFSSIGYVKTILALNQTLQNFSRHLKPGGLLLVEPWFTPEEWNPGTLHAILVDEPELKVARISLSEAPEGNVNKLELHYLVGTLDGVEHFTEHHELGLFTREEYMAAFRSAGLDVRHETEGWMGRGAYIGVRAG